MIAWLSSILLVLGSLFVLIAAIGVARLPDTLSRMHAATKAGSFGASLMLVALVLEIGGTATFIKAGLVILFFYATAPIAGHLLGRLAYRQRKPDSLRIDEWAGKSHPPKDDRAPSS